MPELQKISQLWFDVGIKRYTTSWCGTNYEGMLWFDVGIKRYTTTNLCGHAALKLWFDVGIKRYTTEGSQNVV